MRKQIRITINLGFIIALFILTVSPAGAVKPSAVTPQLRSDSRTATAGFYHLKWRGGGLSSAIYELQEATAMAFSQPKTIYRGPNQATLISGQGNGQYFYRVRVLAPGKPAGAWSAPVTVIVRHYSLARAFTFLAAGATVFLATLALVILGARHEESPE